MHNDEEWSASRVAAALLGLGDAGYPQSRLARMAGVNRSAVNRWSRGENRPGHDAVRRLAAAVWRQHPEAARELVEASGYAWTEPSEADRSPPDALDERFGQQDAADLRRIIRETDPERAEVIIAGMERRFRRRASGG